MPENVINQIRERRLARNETQEGLARSVGVSRQTIIAIENGRYIPSLPLAMKLARFFRVRVEELFTLKNL